MTESLTTLSDRIKIVLMMIDDWPGEFQTLLAGLLEGQVCECQVWVEVFTLLTSKNKVMKHPDADSVNRQAVFELLQSLYTSQRTQL